MFILVGILACDTYTTDLDEQVTADGVSVDCWLRFEKLIGDSMRGISYVSLS